MVDFINKRFEPDWNVYNDVYHRSYSILPDSEIDGNCLSPNYEMNTNRTVDGNFGTFEGKLFFWEQLRGKIIKITRKCFRRIFKKLVNRKINVTKRNGLNTTEHVLILILCTGASKKFNRVEFFFVT